MDLPLLTSSSDSSSEDEEVVFLRRQKLYRNREDCFEKYDEVEFFERFRLTKETVVALLELIEHQISFPTNRGGCIRPMTQLLLTLRFYATGSMLLSAGDFVGVSKTSACRIVKRVSSVIASLRAQYIYMYNNPNEMQRAAEEFYNIASFPRTIGAIDCTLVKIESPGGEDAEIFRCRKGYFALNVQTISDANLKIRNIITRWPGSTHDQTIFNNSRVKREFIEGRYGQYMLIGDSGYAIQPYLMTKLQETQTPAENLFNESILRTRNVVERQYGVWKRRFPILSVGMRVKLPTVMEIIVATAVLHNIAVEMNDYFPDEWFENIEHEDDIGNEQNNEAHDIFIRGRNVRRLLIDEHFARL